MCGNDQVAGLIGQGVGGGGGATGTAMGGTISFPEEQLARMLRNDLGVNVDPQAVRIFLRWRWDRISTLAHQIHKGG